MTFTTFQLFSGYTRIYQDSPGSIHEDIVMDGHRQGKKAYAYKYPLTFLKWWSSLFLKTFTVPAETIPSPNLFHSSQTLLANLNPIESAVNNVY